MRFLYWKWGSSHRYIIALIGFFMTYFHVFTHSLALPNTRCMLMEMFTSAGDFPSPTNSISFLNQTVCDWTLLTFALCFCTVVSSNLLFVLCLFVFKMSRISIWALVQLVLVAGGFTFECWAAEGSNMWPKRSSKTFTFRLRVGLQHRDRHHQRSHLNSVGSSQTTFSFTNFMSKQTGM